MSEIRETRRPGGWDPPRAIPWTGSWPLAPQPGPPGPRCPCSPTLCGPPAQCGGHVWPHPQATPTIPASAKAAPPPPLLSAPWAAASSHPRSRSHRGLKTLGVTCRQCVEEVGTEGEMPGSTSPEPVPTRVSGVSVDPGRLSRPENILVPGAAPSAGCVPRGPSSSAPFLSPLVLFSSNWLGTHQGQVTNTNRVIS